MDECGVCDGDGTSCALMFRLLFGIVEQNQTKASILSHPAIEYLSVSEQKSFIDAMLRTTTKLLSMEQMQIQVARVEGLDRGTKLARDRLISIEDSTASRMLLQTPGSPADGEFLVEMVVNPNGNRLPMTSDIYGKLGEFLDSNIPFAVSNPSLQSTMVPILLDLRDVARQGICGNTICEVGEQLTNPPGVMGESNCLQDCPFPVFLCPRPSKPAIDNELEPCGLNGACSIASGTCTCFAG